MEGYVLEVNRYSKLNTVKRMPLGDKTNSVLRWDKNVNKTRRVLKISEDNGKMLHTGLRENTKRTPQNIKTDKENIESKCINVSSGTTKADLTTHNTRYVKNMLSQKEGQKKNNVNKKDIGNICALTEKEVIKEHIYNKVTKGINRRQCFVQLEINEAIVQNMVHAYLNETDTIVHAISWKSCQVILERDKHVDNIILSAFIQRQKYCSVVLEKDEFVENTVQSHSKLQFPSFPDSDVRNLRKTTVTFACNNKDTSQKSEGKRLLRKRDSKQNYAEESLNETSESNKTHENVKISRSERNVPIYRRMSLLEESDKKKNVDVYELDFSNDEGKGNRRGKGRKHSGNSPNKSQPFERYMKIMVNKLEEKHKKDKKSHSKDKKVNSNTNINTKKGRRQPVAPKKGKIVENSQHAKQKKIENVQKHPKVAEISLCNFPPDKINQELALKHSGITGGYRSEENTSAIKIISSVRIQNKQSNNSYEKVKSMKAIISSANMETTRKTIESNLSIVASTFEDDNIGNESDTSQHETVENLLNISPLQQNKTFHLGNITPIANSTMENHSFQVPPSPWRLNLEVRRNPHFLQYKNSLLPNYNQEMVIDSSIMEKSPSKITNISEIVEPVKRQAKILKYVSGGKNLENLDNVSVGCSLFDAHEFSPVKSSSPKKKSVENKENAGENIRKKIEFVKRNVLGPKVDNAQNSMSPQKNQSNHDSRSTDSSGSDFFGFNNSEPVFETRDPNSKPLRIDPVLPIIIRVHKKGMLMSNGVEKKNCKEKNDEMAGLQEIGLFEDYHPERNLDFSTIKQYKCKRPKRRRSSSPGITDSEDEEWRKVHYVKRKKDIRTKEEEAEAQKWAEEFNKMCQEVEKFPLEIE